MEVDVASHRLWRGTRRRPVGRGVCKPLHSPRNRRSFIHSFIMADIHQQLEDVRKEIQEAKIEKSEALAKGDTSYAAALVAHLTSLQNKENILLKQQQDQGEQR
jgi:hypothetical protein